MNRLVLVLTHTLDLQECKLAWEGWELAHGIPALFTSLDLLQNHLRGGENSSGQRMNLKAVFRTRQFQNWGKNTKNVHFHHYRCL